MNNPQQSVNASQPKFLGDQCGDKYRMDPSDQKIQKTHDTRSDYSLSGLNSQEKIMSSSSSFTPNHPPSSFSWSTDKQKLMWKPKQIGCNTNTKDKSSRDEHSMEISSNTSLEVSTRIPTSDLDNVENRLSNISLEPQKNDQNYDIEHNDRDLSRVNVAMDTKQSDIEFMKKLCEKNQYG
eukprot:GHVL01003103.1.p1 GENE.GHVL01003103.1~~GHVL01003103.1.p1  ORF type:complete len:180 (+),score=30.27 GHVL01003103.1:261-800(+)